MRREPIGRKVLLILAVAIVATGRLGMAADMEISDDPPSDYEGPNMEVSDDPPSDYEGPNMEVSDDGPAEFERNDVDQYETWQEELGD